MKKVVKRIIASVLSVILFCGSAELWKYILIDDASSYTRIMMHELYSEESNIDVLFVGSSHVYRAFIPEITDKAFGAYTFNAGSSSQYMDGSLAIIKEADKTNDLKHIYLELYYDMADNTPYDERTALTSTYILSDYMPFSLNKVQYVTHASSNEHWINSFLIAKRNWKNFFDSNYVKNVIASKQTDYYKNYEYPKADDAIEYYVDRGFVANDAEVSGDTHFNKKAYGEIGVGSSISKDSDWYNSLSDIVDFCNEKDVKLTFFITPEPEWTLVGKGNYQAFHDFVDGIASEFGLDFYDFNLCRNKYFDTNDTSLFKDEDHVNTRGAEIISNLLGKIHTGELDIENVLYDSFTEKISDEDISFYGVAGPIDDGNGNRKCNIISGSDHYDYQVIETKDDGTQTTLKEFDGSKEFSIPSGDTGILSIVCKDLYTDEDTTIEFIF